MFTDAINLLDHASNVMPIKMLAAYAGTGAQPSFGLLMGARAALLREGWIRTETGWAMPEPYASAWKTHKDRVLRESRGIYEATAEGRTSDETKLIMTCRARTILRRILDEPPLEYNGNFGSL